MKTGILCVLIAMIGLGAWICHQFILPRLERPIDTNYLTLDSRLWSTVLVTLFVASIIEAVYRMRRARGEN